MIRVWVPYRKCRLVIQLSHMRIKFIYWFYFFSWRSLKVIIYGPSVPLLYLFRLEFIFRGKLFQMALSFRSQRILLHSKVVHFHLIYHFLFVPDPNYVRLVGNARNSSLIPRLHIFWVICDRTLLLELGCQFFIVKLRFHQLIHHVYLLLSRFHRRNHRIDPRISMPWQQSLLGLVKAEQVN